MAAAHDVLFSIHYCRLVQTYSWTITFVERILHVNGILFLNDSLTTNSLSQMEALQPSIERIDALLNSPTETQHLEFKEARTQFEHSRLREYCVALANEGGGHLLLGITDAPPRSVVGTQAFRDPVSTAERLHQGPMPHEP